MKNHKIKALHALKDSVLVTNMAFGERKTYGGLLLVNDNGKSQGIHPRWAKVYAVGPEQTDIAVGQWILVAHGRWTRGLSIEDETGSHVLRKVDINDILAVSDEEILDENMGNPI